MKQNLNAFYKYHAGYKLQHMCDAQMCLRT